METYAAIAAIMFLVVTGIGICLSGPRTWMPGGKRFNDETRKAQIAHDLHKLVGQMRDIAAMMEPDWPHKTKEMRGAAEIAEDWRQGILEEVRDGENKSR